MEMHWFNLRRIVECCNKESQLAQKMSATSKAQVPRVVVYLHRLLDHSWELHQVLCTQYRSISILIISAELDGKVSPT